MLRFRISMSLDGYVAGPRPTRLFEGVGELRELKLVRTVHAPGVTHHMFRRG